MIKAALLGVAVGDALGVPVEFESREVLRDNPVTGMRAYGTHGQPAGTWSDDSSLTFCLAEALTEGFSPEGPGQKFVRWRHEGWWTPHGEVFDVGGTTEEAIDRLARGVAPEEAGGTGVNDNGNGSLMRVLPLVFYLRDKEPAERWRITRLVSALTHAHIRSVVACFYYLEMARHLLAGEDKRSVYRRLQEDLPPFLKAQGVEEGELAPFRRLLHDDISTVPEDGIRSGGYVVYTLEASVWCLLITPSFEEAVLRAVNLGEDTDTTGAVTGGLAALLYGGDAIPGPWLDALARRADIEDLALRFSRSVKTSEAVYRLGPSS